MNNLKIALAIGAGAVLCTPAIAATLGERYVGAGAAYVEVSPAGPNVDGVGYVAEFNTPVFQNANGGLDLGVGVTYSDIEGRGLDAESQGIAARALYYFNVGETVKPFVSGTIGYSWDDYSEGPISYDDDYIYGSIDAGIEYSVSAEFSLLLSTGVTFLEGSNDDVWGASIEANYWLSPNYGIAVGVDFADLEDGVEQRVYSGTFRFRF